MAEEQSLDEILSARTPEKVEVEIEVSPKAEVVKPEPEEDDEGDDKVQGLQNALTAERGKKRSTRAEFETYKEQSEREKAELRGRLDQLAYQMQMMGQQPRAEPPKPQEIPQIWDDPDKWGGHIVNQALTPVQQQLQQTKETFSKQLAAIKYSDEMVGKAEEALKTAAREAVQRGDQFTIAEWQRIVNSESPYMEAVKWYQNRNVQTEIGGDLTAYKTKLREELKAELAAEFAQSQGGQPQQQPAAVNLPSSFSKGGQGGSRPVAIDPNASLDTILAGRKKHG